MSATTLRYSKLVKTDLANNAINLAGAQLLGHRVTVQMPVDQLNQFFRWERQVGSDRPVGHFIGDSFKGALLASLSKVYNDVDGVSNGLNFSSAILDANTDSRIRKAGAVTANDLIMAYVLYKCYGSSAAPTKSVVYNLEDAQEMLSNATLQAAIETSFRTEENLTGSAGVNKGAVDAMFRDLLATDPMRFFTPSGNQIPGLFETNSDVASSGSWQLVENDKIEVSVEFKFTNPVTRRGVLDPSQQMGSPANTDDTEAVVIPAGSTFNIRLQILATDTPEGSAAKDIAYAEQVAAEAAHVEASSAAALASAQLAVADAEQARCSAAARTQQVWDAHILAIQTQSTQAQKVIAAEAARNAAAAALAAALAQGSSATPADIQTARAADSAAAAALGGAQAMQRLAEAEISQYMTKLANVRQDLATAQTKASAAAAALAAAKAAEAAAATTKAAADAALSAARVAAGITASDPLTQDTTNKEDKVADPQTVVDAGAKVNEAADAAAAAQLAYDAASAAAASAKAASDAAQASLDAMVSAGAPLSSIQIQKAMAANKLSLSNQASTEAKAKEDALAKAQAVLGKANDSLFNAKLQAACNKWMRIFSQLNETRRKRAVDEATAADALAAYSAAQSNAQAAQSDLNSSVNSGSTAAEVVTKRAAVLAANAALASAKATYDVANATVAKDTADIASLTASQASVRGLIIALGGQDPTRDMSLPDGVVRVDSTVLVVDKSRFPPVNTIAPGSVFQVGSVAVSCNDSGAYTITTYTLGAIVTYQGRKYLCVKASDPRGFEYSIVFAQDPLTYPNLWLDLGAYTLPFDMTNALRLELYTGGQNLFGEPTGSQFVTPFNGLIKYLAKYSGDYSNLEIDANTFLTTMFGGLRVGGAGVEGEKTLYPSEYTLACIPHPYTGDLVLFWNLPVGISVTSGDGVFYIENGQTVINAAMAKVGASTYEMDSNGVLISLKTAAGVELLPPVYPFNMDEAIQFNSLYQFPYGPNPWMFGSTSIVWTDLGGLQNLVRYILDNGLADSSIFNTNLLYGTSISMGEPVSINYTMSGLGNGLIQLQCPNRVVENGSVFYLAGGLKKIKDILAANGIASWTTSSSPDNYLTGLYDADGNAVFEGQYGLPFDPRI
jgi:hypothetical protein